LGKRHYYRLAGESLGALNRLIEYDTLMTDFRMSDFRKQLAEMTGRPGPEEDANVLSQKLSAYFTAAQLRGYKEKLGFTDPTIQVRKYGNGILYRAYHVFPKLAMNPGTSKANFGLGDLVKQRDRTPEERIAIYTSYEDYKGQHFAPPGAVKLTDEEFAAYDPDEDSFEYYRTYDEGVPTPADFDPAVHQTENYALADWLNFTHAFLVTGEAHDKLVAYDKAVYDWPMVYQEFRDKAMPPILAILTPYAEKLNSWIEEPTKPGDKRAVSFDRLSVDDWNVMKDDLLQAFTLQEFIPKPMDGCEVLLVPREDTFFGEQIAAALAKVPPHPVNPVSFGFEQRPSLQNHAEFNDKISGYPYMKIERFDGGDVKLLVFRLPPNIRTVNTPESCSPMSLNDYRALAGTDENPPSHVFRIEGEAYNVVTKFDQAMGDYIAGNKTFEAHLTALLQSESPGLVVDEFELRPYKTNAPRELEITMQTAKYVELKPFIEDRFTIVYAHNGYGYGQDRTKLTLKPRTDTENGRAISAAIDDVPYEPYFSNEMDRFFEFYSNKSYDQMKVEKLDGLKQHAVLYFLPSYIGEVDSPPGCVQLTREEFALIFAESMDVRAGSPPPPRPEHLKHLPTPEGLENYESLMQMKKGKDEDGLPLHERTEFGWFKLRP